MGVTVVAIALAASDSPRPAVLDLLTFTMMAAPKLEVALQHFVRYLRIISDAATFTLEADPMGDQWLRLDIEGAFFRCRASDASSS